MRLQTDAFRAHICRMPVAECGPTVKDNGPLTQYRHQINYPRNPEGPYIGNSYAASMSRHLQLRKTFRKLPEDVQNKFNKRLTNGLASGYWEILDPSQVQKLKANNQYAHWLPANFVLKEADSSATKKSTAYPGPIWTTKQVPGSSPQHRGEGLQSYA